VQTAPAARRLNPTSHLTGGPLLHRPGLLLNAAIAGSPLALIIALVIAVGGSGIVSTPAAAAAAPAQAQAVAPVCPAPVSARAATMIGGYPFAADQVENARTIYRVSVERNLPAWAAVIAEAAALQDSGLHTGGATGVGPFGLYHHRPSADWGTAADLADPVRATGAFYGHLVQVPGWQNLPMPVAAQSVQRFSADPTAYARWQVSAEELVANAAGAVQRCGVDHGDGDAVSRAQRILGSLHLPAATPAPVVTAIGWALRQLGTPYSWGGDCTDSHSANVLRGCDCSSLVMMAYATAGIDLPRTTFEQVVTGTAVTDPSQVQPGDLLFEAGSDGTLANPGHVGMYIGSGLVLEAPGTGRDVRIDSYRTWVPQLAAIRREVPAAHT
jgi:cell wall-associated NlpC family hydrolase